jgi:tRNA nucleotidyltransferase (CCA-adding enzyme)
MSADQDDASFPLRGDGPSSPLPPSLMKWVGNLSEDVHAIVDKIGHAGGGIWIVGGAVRDAFLGLKDKDIDFAVSLEPEKMRGLFPDAIPTGIDYGTITLRGKNGHFYEATTLRTESEYADGRRPDVINFGTSLLGDLERRDFTFNAMAIDIKRLLLHDPFNGQKDLNDERVKAVGQAYQRLSEDGLRILRAYRFLDRGKAGVWTFDYELAEALKQHRSMLGGVTNERIWMEWKKILGGKNASHIIERMSRDGVLDRFLPGQWAAQSHRMVAQHHAFASNLEPLERFALLLCENDSIEVEDALKQLKLSKKERITVEQVHARFGKTPINTPASLRIFRSVLGHRAESHLRMEHIILESGLRRPNAKKVSLAHIRDVLTELMALPPLRAGDESIVDGHWIMARTGLGKGIILGRLKMWLHRLQIERDLSTKAEVEQVLCTLNWEHGNHDEWPKVEF